MKGLPAIPSEKARAEAYDRLQSASELLPVAELALDSQWARLDPRLAQILVEHLSRYWRQIPWGALQNEIKKQPWPRAILVLLRFAELAVSQEEARDFKPLIQALEKSLGSIPAQLFFISLQRPNQVVVDEETEFRTEPYELSGFIGSQSLLSRSRWPQGRTHLTRAGRRAILDRLFRERKEVTVNDYIEACKNLVSRRQAQRDLAAIAKPHGFTRNRVYRFG